MKKRDFGLNNMYEGWKSLTEVFCVVNYASCTWVCLLKILNYTFIYSLSGCSYQNTSQWKKYDIYPSLSKFLQNRAFLSFKNYFCPTVSPFYIIFKVFSLYFMSAWFNFVMFFSLVFVYTYLWILVYLQFSKYGLVFIWPTTVGNKLREGV